MIKNIAIVCGGYSGESVVSMRSAEMVLNNIDTQKYRPLQVVITAERWFAIQDGIEYPIDKNDFSVNINSEKVKFAGVFNVLHGTPGEDGKLQGYFDMLQIPYNNSGVLTSAVTFNKNVCNNLVKRLGVNAAESLIFKRGMLVDASEITKKLSLPCFIKPNKGGSSIGTFKIYKEEEIQAAIDKAFAEDDEILVEEFIEGREVTCGVFRYKDEILAFPITEIKTNCDFFDFEAKYTDGVTQEITPAEISDELRDECHRITKFIYEKLDCKGFSRIDYIIKNNKFYFLEVNTVPGMSENSIIPQQANAMGINKTELISMAIEEMLRESVI